MIDYTYWKDSDYFIGHLNDYPDYQTQGKTEKELKENLLDLYEDFSHKKIKNIRKIGHLKVQ